MSLDGGSAARQDESSHTGVFTYTEFETNPKRVMAHANKTGTATVVNEQGERMWRISVLTEDLPELDLGF